MNAYIVQCRYRHDGLLIGCGTFRAASSIGAIQQAARMLARDGFDAVEFIATVQS